MQSFSYRFKILFYVNLFSTLYTNINSTPDMLNITSLVTTSTVLPETITENGTNSTTISSHLLYYQKEKWSCTCYESQELECGCEGLALHRIPQNLTSVKMQKLTIYNTGLRVLHTAALNVYSSHLRDVTLSNLRQFYKIEAGALLKLIQLRTLYIAHAPKLEYLDAEVFQDISKYFKTLRIINCGLLKMPDLRLLPDHLIMHMVDLEGNRIKEIDRYSLNIKTDELILDNNALVFIHNSAFFGSQIAKLSLKLNSKLKNIHKSAFVGMSNLRELDLSSTSIVALPTDGLQEVEVLRIQNTHSLKTIPSVYNFKNLNTAWLTHSFHCCAFKFPQRHDPTTHAENMKRFYKLQKQCIDNGYTTPFSDITFDENYSSQFFAHPRSRRFSSVDKKNDINLGNEENVNAITGATLLEEHEEPDDGSVEMLYTSNPIMEDSAWLDTVAELQPNKFLDALCGNLTQRKFDIKCYPKPDALNPCEDVMGSDWLRGSVWIVVLMAVFGNVAVLVVLFSNRTEINVPKFLICNLAFADLCMGLYLLLIAAIDAHSKGEYFNFAFDWQYGNGCKAAGFLTVFACHLSIFTLTIITLERWFAITHAIYLNKRIKLKSAIYIMITGWIYSATMAALPLFSISNYSSTSICLPMEARDVFDIAYLLTVLGVSGLAFVVIVVCYAQIYFSLGKDTRSGQAYNQHHSHGEMTVAKKMALLVFTNFACWAPIAFFALTALAGYPLINVTKSKILLVFFYPLNSCANPYLYAILTTQYRRDLFVLLSKYGMCTQRAQQYKMTYSMPTQTIPAVTRGSITNSQINRRVSKEDETLL